MCLRVVYLPAQITNYIVGGTCNSCHLSLHDQVYSGGVGVLTDMHDSRPREKQRG